MTFKQAAHAAVPKAVPISLITPTETLPSGANKYDAIRLVRRLRANLGLAETDLSVLEALSDPTRAEDWTDTMRQPINHQMQCVMSERVGIDPRSFRRSEKRLEHAGIIAKNVPINGYRSALRSYSLGQAAYGISLQPLIDNYETLLEQHKTLERSREEAGYLRLEIRILHRRIIKAVEEIVEDDLNDPLYQTLMEFRKTWPRRPSDILSIEGLSEHLSVLKTFWSEVVEKEGKKAPGVELRNTNESVPSDSTVPRHIQTKRSYTVRCNDQSYKQTDDKSSDSKFNTPTPNGSGESREKQNVGSDDGAKQKNPNNSAATLLPETTLTPHFVEMLNPDVLMELVSDDWRFYVTGLAPQGALPRFEHFETAAIHMLRELGISPNAYEQALAIMGTLDAMLSLIVIDRNRNHPTRPVINPGGALRAFVRKRQAGQLNLQNSIFGILQRENIQ